MEEQNKKLLKEVSEVVYEAVDDRVKDLEERFVARINDAEENIAASVNKTFQRIDDELYAFRREHASGMKKFGERLDHLNNFVSDLYDDHERRLKILEAA